MNKNESEKEKAANEQRLTRQQWQKQQISECEFKFAA